MRVEEERETENYTKHRNIHTLFFLVFAIRILFLSLLFKSHLFKLFRDARDEMDAISMFT